ncbi:centriolar coiled-coil protein of 110 kDa [Spea bombifrons]|uniref:centriolar coiled-coil protein of 110 kDa n=1 Tax=Spea bombifrons TaxID=233779 RepID=UPI002349CE75|nr:centriolar coiled-coil protein of 110 kDa [Spea bombifrons]
MEAYEEFCRKQFARIQGEAICSDSVKSGEHGVSVIQFHGVAVLSPLLTVEKRQEMQQYKIKAIELDEKRQNCRKTFLLNRVQEILETVQVKKTTGMNAVPTTTEEFTDQATKAKNMNGFALLPNVINVPIKSAKHGPAKFEKSLEDSKANTEVLKEDCLALRPTKSPMINHENDVPTEASQHDGTDPFEAPPPTKGAPDPYVMSLQNLLKKSREYIEKEQSRRNMKSYSKGNCNESHSDKENDTIKISDSLKEKARIMNRSRSCSPLMVDKPALNKSNTLLQAASCQGESMGSAALSRPPGMDIPLKSGTISSVDTESDEELKKSCVIECESSFVKSLTGSYAKLPSPEPSLSPQMHRRRPRPLSAGHILINNPINAYELSPKGKDEIVVLPETNVKSYLSDPMPTINGHKKDNCSITGRSLSKNEIVGSPDLSKSFEISALIWNNKATSFTTVTDVSQTEICKETHLNNSVCATNRTSSNPDIGSQNVDTPVLKTEHELKSSGSPEMVKRVSPAQLNKSYDVETPSPILMQSQSTTQTTDTPSSSLIREQSYENNFDVKRRLELDLDSTRKDVYVPPPSSDQEKKLPQEERNHLESFHIRKNDALSNSTLDDNLKKKMLAFEQMRKKLEEQHAQQLSLLIAEQEREQERLQREFEEERKRLRFKKIDVPGSPGMLDDSKQRPDKTNRDESNMSEIETSHVEPYHVYSSYNTMAAPSQQSCGSANEPSVSLWRPSPSGALKISTQRSLSRARTRWSQVYSPAMQIKLNKVTALAKGFLTRRLMQTEKLKNLKQTVKDTAEFMRTFQADGPVKRGIVSAQDALLRERVLAQLRAALYEIHDVFFEMDITERMNILAHDRELRREKLIRQMEKLKSPRDRVTLSSATQKSLDRKKLTRVGETGISNKKLQSKPKALETRILQPNQGQNAPINKLLCRQGSICKKNPKKEAKCCDNLRRQHSLG